MMNLNLQELNGYNAQKMYDSRKENSLSVQFPRKHCKYKYI